MKPQTLVSILPLMLLIQCTEKQPFEPFDASIQTYVGYEWVTHEELAIIKENPLYLDTLQQDSCRVIDMTKDYLPIMFTKPWKE